MKNFSIPVLPLRDIVVFPHMVAPLFVGRKLSVNALNHVMTSDKFILLITQKNSEVDSPAPKDLHTFNAKSIFSGCSIYGKLSKYLRVTSFSLEISIVEFLS